MKAPALGIWLKHNQIKIKKKKRSPFHSKETSSLMHIGEITLLIPLPIRLSMSLSLLNIDIDITVIVTAIVSVIVTQIVIVRRPTSLLSYWRRSVPRRQRRCRRRRRRGCGSRDCIELTSRYLTRLFRVMRHD